MGRGAADGPLRKGSGRDQPPVILDDFSRQIPVEGGQRAHRCQAGPVGQSRPAEENIDDALQFDAWRTGFGIRTSFVDNDRTEDFCAGGIQSPKADVTAGDYNQSLPPKGAVQYQIGITHNQ